MVTDNPGLRDYAYQALLGRGLMSQASACPQGEMNRVALHVCCVGNFDLMVPPPEMLDVLVRRILLPWMEAFSIPPERVVGHRDFNPAKSCPGLLFNLPQLRKMLQ